MQPLELAVDASERVLQLEWLDELAYLAETTEGLVPVDEQWIEQSDRGVSATVHSRRGNPPTHRQGSSGRVFNYARDRSEEEGMCSTT